MALSDGGFGQFRSFCYTDPADRQFIKQAAELAARHFDEVIQDDFFFVTTRMIRTSPPRERTPGHSSGSA